MQKIIPIDENARIKIIADNFMLQYRIKTKNKRIAWRTDGFFSYSVSSFKQHFSNTLCRAIQAREDLRGWQKS